MSASRRNPPSKGKQTRSTSASKGKQTARGGRQQPHRSGSRPAGRQRSSASSAGRSRSTSRLRRLTAGDRVYLLALFVLILGLAVMAVGPLQSYTMATDRVDELDTRRDRLETAVSQLEERRERLQDPEELEIIARSELGLVQPGEEPYVVSDDEEDPDRFRPDPTRDARPEDVAWYRRLGRLLVQWLGSG